MKLQSIVLTIFMFVAFVVSANADNGVWIYKGKWFDITVPNEYKYKKNNLCLTEQNCDSAFFVTDKENKYLFVFSPQWGGNENEYISLFNLNDDERLVLDSLDKKNYIDKSGRVVEKDAILRREVTINKEGSYIRKYIVHTNLVTNTRYVFGIKWPSKEKMDMKQFQLFKKSLVQYSD